MIINLTGSISSENSKLILDTPNVYFDRRFSYKVGVHHIHVELIQTEENKTMYNYELLSLDTNLVDRSSANPTQTIIHFWHLSKQNKIQFAKVPEVVYYTLHLYELENTTFELRRHFSRQAVSIKNIFVQLEILKVDAYGRI